MSAGAVTIPEMIEALIDHLPPPPGVSKWTATVVCARTHARAHARGLVRVTEPHLSQVRSGRLQSPSWDMMISLADAFGVRPDYFTIGYHRLHQDMAIRDRVLHARADYPQLLLAAAAVNDLPEMYRHAVFRFIAVFAEHE